MLRGRPNGIADSRTNPASKDVHVMMNRAGEGGGERAWIRVSRLAQSRLSVHSFFTNTNIVFRNFGLQIAST